MPPKKVPKAPPKASTKAKTPAKKKPTPPPPPPPPKRRRAVSRSPSEPIPEWDKGLSSLAARERKRFKLSCVSLYEDLDEDYIAQQAEKLMGESRNTWGTAHQSPIKGSRRSKPKSRGMKRGRDIEDTYIEMFAGIQQKQQPIPNFLSRSPILRISLEIREMIYGYLLVYLTPIMVKSDWMSLERNQFVDHSIILVCKQFAFEASSFIYKNNTFQSLIRESTSFLPLRFEAPSKISTAFHSLFRNVIIDCSKTCWSLDWHEKVAEGLNALAEAKPTIDTLTLVVVPQRVGMSDTALGMKANPVTFADFLWYPSPFMTAVRKLAPRTLKVIIKKSGGKRLGIVVDLAYLRIETALLIPNEEMLSRRDLRLSAIRNKLNGLKVSFENIFDDDEWAIREGICELISTGRRDEIALDGITHGGEVGNANVERPAFEGEKLIGGDLSLLTLIRKAGK
ncbi:hypothetical protein IFR05_008260 [Cadophora sp. M221]|nr:hypothetical protein IFR05_008260 [Cadophora sp. M221]